MIGMKRIFPDAMFSTVVKYTPKVIGYLAGSKLINTLWFVFYVSVANTYIATL